MQFTYAFGTYLSVMPMFSFPLKMEHGSYAPFMAWCSRWTGRMAWSLNVSCLGTHLLRGPSSKATTTSQSRVIGLEQGTLSSIFLRGFSVNFLLGFERGFPHSFPAPDTLGTVGTAKLGGPRGRAAYTAAQAQLHCLLVLWTPLRAGHLKAIR